jgi:hypothetical protein
LETTFGSSVTVGNPSGTSNQQQSESFDPIESCDPFNLQFVLSDRSCFGGANGGFTVTFTEA